MENQDFVDATEDLNEQENYLDYVEEEFLEYGSDHQIEGVPDLSTDGEGDVDANDEEPNQNSVEVLTSEHPFNPKSRKKVICDLNDVKNTIINCGFCTKKFGKLHSNILHVPFFIHSIVDRKNYYRRHFKRVHLEQEIENATYDLREQNRDDEIHELQMYTCEYCAHIEVVKTKYLDHIYQHSGEDLFKCRHCNSKFASKVSLKEHIAYKHNDLKVIYFFIN